MRYETYYESVDFENNQINFSVEYVMNDVRYAADGVAATVSDAYTRIREHRAEFRTQLANEKKRQLSAQRDRITDAKEPQLTNL